MSLQFFEIISRLKDTKRTGWVLRGISDAESISDHMYRMAIMAMTLINQEDTTLNKDHCIKMCLAHDLAECLAGDITPHCGISEEEKHELEETAFMKLLESMGCSNFDCQGKELYDLWQEYELGQSENAKFVKQLDKLEMIMQAHHYQAKYGDQVDLTEFYEAKSKITHPNLLKLLREMNLIE